MLDLDDQYFVDKFSEIHYFFVLESYRELVIV